MAISDMTKVGKECAIAALISTKWGIDCFEKAGFTTPCATIWTCVALGVVLWCDNLAAHVVWQPRCWVSVLETS